MRAKAIIALVAAAGPVIYCGGLVFHFIDVGGSIEGATTIGLGPTILGLAVAGLLFCIPVFLKVARLLDGPRSPGSGGGGLPDEPMDDGKSAADADAMIARYKAQRSAEIAASPSTPRPAYGASTGGPVRQQGFGRRAR